MTRFLRGGGDAPAGHPVSGCFGAGQVLSDSMPREAQRRLAARTGGSASINASTSGSFEPGLQPGLEDGDPVEGDAVDRVLHQFVHLGPAPRAVSAGVLAAGGGGRAGPTSRWPGGAIARTGEGRRPGRRMTDPTGRSSTRSSSSP